MSTAHAEEYALKPVLKPIHLWAIGVGMVISGDHFGWNFGLAQAGPLGFFIAMALVTVMYVTFIFSYTELTSAIPNSGGPYAYARKALGPTGGFMAGFFTLVEFVFAPPAIALAVGAYLEFIAQTFGLTLPALGPLVPKVWIALLAIVGFIGLNLRGLKEAVTFELFVTVLAIVELLLFCAICIPKFQVSNLVTQPPLPGGLKGILAAIPFAMWFYLAIEGIAMSAEETANPKRDIPLGYISAMATLIILATLISVCSIGVMPWQELAKVDKPLPVVAAHVLPAGHFLVATIASLSIFGLIASLNGIIIGYSRQTYALARARYLPHSLAQLNANQAPAMALIVPGIFSLIACLTGFTDQIITMAGMGAIGLYIISMISLFVLRRKEPHLERPFTAPLYPLFPALALGIAVLSGVAVIAYNALLFAIFMGLFGVGYVYFRKVVVHDLAPEVYAAHDFETLRVTGELPPLKGD